MAIKYSLTFAFGFHGNKYQISRLLGHRLYANICQYRNSEKIEPAIGMCYSWVYLTALCNISVKSFRYLFRDSIKTDRHHNSKDE